MGTESERKLNQLHRLHKKGTVLLSSWLKGEGFSSELQAKYRKSNWLESMGHGAMKFQGDEVNYLGAIFALQQQAGLSIHPGGKTALGMNASSHYISFRPRFQTLIGLPGEKLPRWFNVHSWGIKPQYYTTSFLPKELGMKVHVHKDFDLQISDNARAMMESLYLCPKELSLEECQQVMEGLISLRPAVVQELLESCSSVKVKRLFLFMAKRANHPWVNRLNISSINLGSGKRSFAKGGIYNAEFKIVIPSSFDT